MSGEDFEVIEGDNLKRIIDTLEEVLDRYRLDSNHAKGIVNEILYRESEKRKEFSIAYEQYRWELAGLNLLHKSDEEMVVVATLEYEYLDSSNNKKKEREKSYYRLEIGNDKLDLEEIPVWKE